MAVLPFIWKILLPINMGLNPILNTTLGPIKGNWELSSNNIAYMAFTGIPFAKPPVGQLRFAVSLNMVKVRLCRFLKTRVLEKIMKFESRVFSKKYRFYLVHALRHGLKKEEIQY